MDESTDELDVQSYDPSPVEALLREKKLKQTAIMRFRRRIEEIDRQLEQLAGQNPQEEVKPIP